MVFGGVGVLEGVAHAHAFVRSLLDAVHEGRLTEAGRLEDGRRDVDDVVELVPDLALGVDATRPVHDGAVAGPAPVGGHLLGPLVGRVHRVRPAHGVVVVRVRGPEVVDPGGHELRGLQRAGPVENEQLVEGAVQVALRRGAVVADDHVDERVVEDLEVGQGVDQPTDMVVGVLEEPGVDLHLAGHDRPQVLGRLVPCGDLVVPRGQLSRLRDHTELLLSREGFLAQRVPALVELAAVFVRPLGRNVVGRVRRTRRVVGEERLVRHQGLLLPHPRDRAVGHVLGQVVALLRSPVGLHGRLVLVERRRVLVGLAAEEAVEVLESPAAAGPVVEGPHRTGLPDRHLVALAELRRAVAVELEGLRQRRAVVGPQRVVAGRRGRDLGDPTHAHAVVVPPR